ncbi:hypothetical protein ACFL43_00075 [Thermodesulfobacteriota bacterium]
MLIIVYCGCLVCAAVLVGRRPHILLRPSFWFACIMLFVICGAAAFTGEEINTGFHVDSRLSSIYFFRLLTLLFPGAVFGWILVTPGITERARRIGRRVRVSRLLPQWGCAEWFGLAVLAVLALLILAFYLAAVPLQSSGLWAIVFEPENSVMAREHSLKLLGSPLLKYAYWMYLSVLAPLICALVIVWPKKNLRVWLPGAGIFAVVVVGAMLSGARVIALNICLAVAVAYVLRRGFTLGWRMLLTVFLAGSLLVAVLSAARVGVLADFDYNLMIAYLKRDFIERAFIIPFQSGVWSNIYSQEFGLPGIASVRPLALLMGLDWVNLPLHAACAQPFDKPYTLSSMTSLNACFLFNYQAAFGLVKGWGISLVLLCGLDLLLFAFSGLSGALLCAFTAALLVSLTSLLSGAYTTCLVTHGVVPIALLALLFSRIISGFMHFRAAKA